MGWTRPKTRLEFNRHYIVHLVGAARDNRFSTQQQPTPFPLTTQMPPDPFPFILPDGDTKSTKETISNITDVSLEITKYLLTTEGKGKKWCTRRCPFRSCCGCQLLGQRVPQRNSCSLFSSSSPSTN
ncbi:hypothetical protein ACFX2A_004547 [Malus domestica]